jgi:hypothetical protein
VTSPPRTPAPGQLGDLLGQFWPALAAPLATEIGSVMALIEKAVAGTGAGLVALVLLALLMPRVRPADWVIRVTIVLAGPPLRYVLLLIAAGKVWLDASDGPLMALLLVLVLAFLLPLGGFLVMQARAREGA